MSKRNMEFQGGGERYGFGDDASESSDRPMKATAAQMAKRSIAGLKKRTGTGSARSSRQPSPAVPQSIGAAQSFQAPPSANFSFSFGNNDSTPSFGMQPQNNTPSFNFGGNSQAEGMSQNGNIMFGNKNDTLNNNINNNNHNRAAVFGNTFGSNQPQPQANGFNPATSSIFSQNSSNAPTTAPFSFGQSSSTMNSNSVLAQSNGNASSGFAFGTQNKKSEESAPSFSFGIPPTQPNASAPSFQFGSSSNATPAEPAPTFNFGTSSSTMSKEKPSTIFPAFSQQTPNQAEPTTSTNSGKSAPLAAVGSASATSVFDSLSQPKGVVTGMFTSNQQQVDQTPKAQNQFAFTQTTGVKNDKPQFNFGQPAQSSLTEASTPAKTPFAFGSSHTQTPATSNKASTEAVGGFGLPKSGPAIAVPFEDSTKSTNSSTQISASSLFNFAPAQNHDMNMTTPEQTPKKLEQVPDSTPEQRRAENAFSSAPAKSLFSRMTPAEVPNTSVKPRLGGNLFNLAGHESALGANKASSLVTPDLSKTTGTIPSTSNIFGKDETPKSQVSEPASAGQALVPNDLSPGLQPPPSARALLQHSTRTPTAKDWVKLRSLNESLLTHLQTQDADVDWSPIVFYYLDQAANLMGKERFKTGSAASKANTSSAPTDSSAQKGKLSASSSSKPSHPAHLADASVEAPVAAFSPAKSLKDSSERQAPATETRTKPTQTFQYPNLSNSASNTAKLFASTLDKTLEKPKIGTHLNVAKPPTTMKPSNPGHISHKDASKTSDLDKGPKGFALATDNASSFLASFGKQAAANQAEEQKKRKAEEFDSEDEDEATWEAKDRAKQEEKRRKIEQGAAKSSGFVFDAAIAAPSEKSVFTLGANHSQGSTKTAGERNQGSGDLTWKPETPIKFGRNSNDAVSSTPLGAPPPNMFSGLFGSNTKTPAPNSSRLAPPALGYNFGGLKDTSVDTSRATTPGLTTDGETSNAGEGEPNEGQNDRQVEDMTALLAEETAGAEILFETRMARAVKLDQKKVQKLLPDGSSTEVMEPGWVEKGRGPLYMLKDKKSGKARILLKVPPLGRAAMNFPVLGMEYKLAAGKTKVVQGAFVDHIGSSEDKGGKPSTWTIQVREASEASDMLAALNKSRPQ